uniref:Uncharacterized protein n=1 Tax=Euplotes crassus TaxID=5936 RepID=A0A7S3KUB7_EUPCR
MNFITVSNVPKVAADANGVLQMQGTYPLQKPLMPSALNVCLAQSTRLLYLLFSKLSDWIFVFQRSIGKVQSQYISPEIDPISIILKILGLLSLSSSLDFRVP